MIHYKYKDEKLNNTLSKPFVIDNLGHIFYGFPNINDGKYYKLQLFYYYKDSNHLDFEKLRETWFDNENYKLLIKILSTVLRGFTPDSIELVDYSRCTFTNTPNHRYVIDYIPNEDENVVLLSACSGHGFKFSNTIGEHVANILLGKEKPYYEMSLEKIKEIASNKKTAKF